MMLFAICSFSQEDQSKKFIKITELSIQNFQPFGYYKYLFSQNEEKIGEPPIEYFRDMIQQDLGNNTTVSYSICKIQDREKKIDVLEYHSRTAEVILPLDNDMIVFVAPATPSANPPLEKMKAFIIPKGTLIVLKRGVWHHAPFTKNDENLNILVALPERTYANDAVVVKLKKEEYIYIED